MSKDTSNKSPKNTKVDSDIHSQLLALTESLQRERADSTNLRRRHEQEISGLKDYLKIDIIRQLLPVIDNFERSLKHVPKDLETNEYVAGIKSIIKQFEKVITELGVTKIDTVGYEFNPSLHEAISMEEGNGDIEIISQELQPGYKLGDNVIRPAIVKVKPQKAGYKQSNERLKEK
ncbi:MAG TPA: nucleotide exchange factor GrpE [Candidatus Saccharimonadia bacterium]|nr:nucleotide exchange factor GrpE [Candidatus Saccharimonadia bacterium]